MSVSLVRRWGVWMACLVSLIVGSALVWRLMTPDSLNAVMTAELLALVGLFVLPVMAAWSFLAQRRAAPTDLRPARHATREHAPAARPDDAEHHRRITRQRGQTAGMI